MCNNNYSNKERFDKAITINNMVQFFLPHGVVMPSSAFSHQRQSVFRLYRHSCGHDHILKVCIIEQWSMYHNAHFDHTSDISL